MQRDEYEDLEAQVNRCFEEIGGSMLEGPQRDKDMSRIQASPFFIDREGQIPFTEGGDSLAVSIVPKFGLGVVVGTTKFKSTVDPDEALVALSRHAIGDWVELCVEDKRANDKAVEQGQRILSSYRTKKGTTFWFITEHDRSVTTGLLPEEY